MRSLNVTQLKLKLIDSFSEYVPATHEFQVGYLEGWGSQKRWIVRSEDLEKMYDTFYNGDEIKLWYEGKSKDSHSARGQNARERLRMMNHLVSEIVKLMKRDIHTKLEKKHGDKYTGPQYTLWAKFIRMDRHEIYEHTPPIPLMTGEQKGRSKKCKDSVSDALAGAATAIANALTGKGQQTSSPARSSSKVSFSTSHALSPNNQAGLRRKHLEDLRTLSQLFDDGILTHGEFQEQKQNVLSGLRKLTFTQTSNNIQNMHGTIQ